MWIASLLIASFWRTKLSNMQAISFVMQSYVKSFFLRLVLMCTKWSFISLAGHIQIVPHAEIKKYLKVDARRAQNWTKAWLRSGKTNKICSLNERLLDMLRNPFWDGLASNHYVEHQLNLFLSNFSIELLFFLFGVLHRAHERFYVSSLSQAIKHRSIRTVENAWKISSIPWCLGSMFMILPLMFRTTVKRQGRYIQ